MRTLDLSGLRPRTLARLAVVGVLLIAAAFMLLASDASSARAAPASNAPLLAPDAPDATQDCQYGVEFVAAGSTWNYPDPAPSDRPTGWPSPDDSGWSSGATTIGFPASEVDYEIPKVTGNITYYFTHHFTVTNANDYVTLKFRILRDDGAVVYLNGAEAFRTNMPTGTIDHSTLASGTADEGVWYSYTIDATGLLVDGDNLLAVEVHQASSDSSDLHLNLELKADTCEPFSGGPSCYTVADSSNTGKNENFMDVLVQVDLLAGVGRYIGQADGSDTSTATWNDEAAEWDPHGQRLLAFDEKKDGSGAQLGELDTTDGLFYPIGSPITECNLPGPDHQWVSDIDGIARDHTTDVWYATVRKSSSSDYLIKFDPDTGAIDPNGFGTGVSCVEVEPPSGDTSLNDIDDIGTDPTDGTLYGVANNGATRTRVVIIDKTDGSTTDLGEIQFGGTVLLDVEGFSIDETGRVIASTGNDSEEEDESSVWELDLSQDPIPATFIAKLDGFQTLIDYGDPNISYEDYEAITCFGVSAEGEFDFGDAPTDDGNYPTLLAHDGARHEILASGNPFMGPTGDDPDPETDGQPTANADGDDLNGATPDDENGVTFTSTLTPGSSATVQIDMTGSSVGCYINAWVDFNGDDSWAEAGDKIVDDVLLAPGSAHTLSFPVPTTASPGITTYSRFRCNTDGGLTYTGGATDGEVEDHEVEIIEEEQRDWGDAPDPLYPTLSSPPDPTGPDGASHVVGVGGPYLGLCVDSEADGQPNSAATGDDGATGTTTVGSCQTAGDDEDGVTFPAPLVQGDAVAPVTVDVSNAAACVLNAWIDFNGDQDWDDSGEQIFTDLNLAAGSSNPLTFFVPGNAAVGDTFARFRCASTGGLLPYGPAADGEVEDYQVTIEAGTADLDWGDAPDGPYPTLSSSNGANHVIGPIFLGVAIDADPDGQPTPGDDGDDNDAQGDDEDGVTFASLLVPGATANISVVASDACTLSAWMDFDGNGSWNDSGEDLFPAGQALVTGSNPLSFPVPPSAQPGRTHARFRCSTVGKLPYDGSAPDGEVEDYLVVIVENDNNLDYGDLPDGPYPTLLSSGGAYHVIDGTFLGVVPPDPETDGQPTPAADGDDLNDTSGGGAGNDEDGVVFLNPLMPGSTAQVQVTAGTPGYLCAFVDFDGDGTLDTVSYTAATSGGSGTPPTAPGTLLETYLDAADTYTFDITVPGNATGTTPSRFRFTAGTGQGCSTPDGGASTGEVEDYNLAAIGDLVWDDQDLDGIQDTGEPGLSGITVELWLPGGGSPIATTTTDGNGNYEFPGVPPGDYFVEFVPPSGMSFSPTHQGTDPTVDSDPNVSSGQTDVITLSAGDDDDTVDAGLYQVDPSLVAIGNIVWNDVNGDTIMQSSEVGIPGAEVRLYADNGDGIPDPEGTDGSAVSITNTDANGFYLFPNVVPGNYFVALFDPQSLGFVKSSPGHTNNPDTTGDQDNPAGQGDDGTVFSSGPGGFVVSQVFNPTVLGQTTPDSGNPINLDPTSAYMTIDFGLNNAPTALTLLGLDAETTNTVLPVVVFAALGLLVAGGMFLLRRRRQI